MAAAVCASYSVGMANWNLAQFIGKNIARLRSRRDITQEELAARIGRKQPTISQWENGETLPRLPELIDQLENAEIDPRELFYPEPDWEVVPLRAPEPPLHVVSEDPDIAAVVEVLERLPRDTRRAVAELATRLGQAMPQVHDEESARLLREFTELSPVIRRGLLKAVHNLIEATQGGSED